jgi:organic radical activating enzyme
VEEDFVNYKKPSMFIGFPTCNWKCEKECGMRGICQNSSLATSPTFDISIEEIVKRYTENPISKAIVFGGLEPMDSWSDMVDLIDEFRKYTEDEIIVYTGYRMDEICRQTYWLGNKYNNIIFKFGRFIPNQPTRYDEVLGITLVSDNQHAERIS